jgi:hypothetical protein
MRLEWWKGVEMERLTERDIHGNAICKKEISIDCNANCKDCDYDYECFKKLADYEDAEEQGLLLRLPKGIEDIDKRVIEYSLIKAINLSRYGVDVDDKLKNATETAYALSQAYNRGRQDERDRFYELRKEEAEQKLAEMKGE